MRRRHSCSPYSASSSAFLLSMTTIVAISVVSSFQVGNRRAGRPTLLTSPPQSANMWASPSPVRRSQLYSSGGDDSNERSGDDSLPFFAQTPTKENEAVAAAVEETKEPSSSVAVAEKVPESKAALEARTLRAQAEKARLEAEKMDAMLTLEKIAKLEKKLANVESLKKHPEEEQGIREQIDLLSRKLNGEDVAVTAPKKAAEKVAVKKEEQTMPTTTTTITMDDEETMNWDPISEEELEKRTANFLAAPKVLREMTAKSAGFDDDSDVKGIVTKIYNDEQRQKQKSTLPKEGELPIVMDEEEIQNAIEGFEKLPEAIRNMVATSVGMENGDNATAVINKLNEEKRLFPNQGGDGDGLEGGFQVNTEFIDIFEDVAFAEKAAYVRGMLPEVTRKEYQTPSDDDVDLFFRKVCGRKTFNPYSKPEVVPGGVIIRGENCVGGENAIDDMVSALEAKVKENNLDSKLKFFYILDPTPVTEEQIDVEEYELPVLLLTGADVAPETKFTTKGIISALGVIGIGSFALGAFSFNDGVMDRLTNAADLGDGNLSWLSDLAAPLFLATLGIQLAHELAHRVVAFKDKFDVGLPTIVPSLQLGITGAITPLNSPPKNFKSLFDFAIAGPLVGIIVSLALMYVGIEKTAFMDAAELSQLPGLPVELLRSSSLGGGIIEYLLGDGILLSPDPTATVSLHPYAIAGFVGIMSNALSLLPVGNTDGGRIAHAVLGRSIARIIQGFTLLFLVVAGLFGADESNILLFYSLFVTIWQREPEIPCKNEVDELDLVRGGVAIATAVLVALVLVPMT